MKFVACLISIIFVSWSAAATDTDTLCIKGTTVAVIDTGADVHHPMFNRELWKNPGEIGTDKLGRDRTTNGIDDDNNGYIDDVYGWNFFDDDQNLQDYSGHGTHIAGLIKRSATGAPVKLMILKYFDPRHENRSAQSEFISALRYAIEMKADVINISGGGYQPHSAEWALIKKAQEQGITIVAASGNTLKPTEKPTKLPFFPAAYANVVSVVATNQAGDILRTSNVPPKKLNVYIRGDAIESALPNGSTGAMTGSSQAAASYTGKLLAQFASECKQDDSLSKRKHN